MDQDDLPPDRHAPEQPSFSGALGYWFGTFAWIALFLAIAGVILYGISHWR